MASDVGIGLRLDLPIGPLRLDYGYPVMRDGYQRRRPFQLQRGLSILNEYMWLQSNAIPATVSPVFMKKSLSILAALTLVVPIAAFAQGTVKIGTVDMQRAFKDYNKTKEAEVKINDAKNAAKKEYDDRAEAYKKALDEINNLNKQLESPALSADKKTGMAKERDDKIANIKSMEREISDFRQTRERQLQEQLMRMREGIVKEITDVVDGEGQSQEP